MMEKPTYTYQEETIKKILNDQESFLKKFHEFFYDVYLNSNKDNIHCIRIIQNEYKIVISEENHVSVFKEGKILYHSEYKKDENFICDVIYNGNLLSIQTLNNINHIEKICKKFAKLIENYTIIEIEQDYELSK